nr:hypothetical protein [Terriglobus saanensis]
MPELNVAFAGFVIPIHPVEKGVPNHFFVQSAAAQKECHRFEEVQDRFCLEHIATSQSCRCFGTLYLLGGAKEVILQAEKKVDRLVESRSSYLIDETAESDDDTSGRDHDRNPIGKRRHAAMIEDLEVLDETPSAIVRISHRNRHG